jgi:hypothetical protein
MRDIGQGNVGFEHFLSHNDAKARVELGRARDSRERLNAEGMACGAGGGQR